MEMLKRFFSDKGRIGVAIACLFMLSIVMVSAMTGESFALEDGQVCYQCSTNTSKFAIGTSNVLPASSECPNGAGWIPTDDSNCESSVSVSASFNSNGGSPSTYSSKTCTIKSGASSCSIDVSSLTPTRTGYNFKGWGTSASCTSGNTSTISLSSSTAYFACWAKKTYTVTFNVNGGSGTTMSTKSVSHGGTYGELPQAYRTGYDFLGWYTEASGGTKVTSSTTIKENSNHTLYAQWKAQTYVVTFDPTGGTTSTASKQVTYDSSYWSLPVPTKSGHTFLGWYTTSSSDGTQIKEDTTVTINKNHTLYARWSVKTVTINFVRNSDGDEVDGFQEKKTVAANGTYGALPILKRFGYEFEGWFTSATDGTEVTGTLPLIKDEDHYLYAHWKLKMVTVHFVRNSEGDEVEGFQDTKTIAGNGTYGALPILKRDGYNFEGWFTSTTGGSEVTGSSKLIKDEAHYLYARWSVKTVTVNFVRNSDGDEVSGFQEKKTVPANGTYGALPILTRLGYNFEGWFTSTTGSSEVTGTSPLIKDEDHYLYAHWTKKEIKIHLNRNSDGDSVTGLPANQVITLNGENTYRDLPNLERKNYNFKGWFTSTTSNEKIENGDKLLKNESHYLYAQWEKNDSSGDDDSGNGSNDDVVITYTIKYNANGGSGAPTSQTKNKDKALILSSTKPTRIGHEFLGWSESASATSATYQPSGTYTNDANTTLYAIWKANEYTVKYNSNGGTGTMSDSIYTYGVSKSLTANSFSKEGFTFKCWNTKADGSGINYTDKQNIIIAEDLTLYAIWKSNDSTGGDSEEETKVTYYIRYNSNGGTGTMKDSEHTYGYASNLTKNTFTRPGYTFNGWNTKADGTGTTYTDGQTLNSNLASTNGEVVTLYAQWLENSSDDEDGNTTTPGTGNNNPSNGSDQGNNNIDKSPQTGMIATILVSLISIGALGGVVYYRKKIKI